MSRPIYAMLLLVLVLAASCNSTPDNVYYNQGYREGHDAGVTDGRSEGYHDGYAAGYEAARPAGWSPQSGFGAFSLGFVAVLGGLKILGGLLFSIYYLVRKSSSEPAMAAKIVTAVLAATAAWVAVVISSADDAADALFLLPTPNSATAILAVVFTSMIVMYAVCRGVIALIGDIEGTRPQVACVGILSFVSTVLAHMFFQSGVANPHPTGFLITYIFIGAALGGIWIGVRLLLKEDDRHRMVAAGRRLIEKRPKADQDRG